MQLQKKWSITSTSFFIYCKFLCIFLDLIILFEQVAYNIDVYIGFQNGFNSANYERFLTQK